MGEIDGPKFSVNQVNFGSVKKTASEIEQPTPVEQGPQLTDFSDAKAELDGRLSVLFKGNDNVNNDLKAIIDNPQIADNSDKMFEASYAAALKAGMPNPYEEAAGASTTAF